mgnify:FL=1
MNVSIVIPNYNGEGLLKKNLPKVFDAIFSYKNGRAELVVIDDCSLDNSINLLKRLKLEFESKYPQIKFAIIKNETNLGFSSNVNQGIKNSSGDILILLNTDVVPEKNFLMPLLSHFKDKRVFAVGCMDKSIENGRVVLRGRGLGKWEKGFLVHSRGEIDKTNTLWVSGGSGAFRKSIWDKLGGFNSLYNPFYWEDIDLSYRALKSGYKIVFEPKSIVLHEHEKGAIKKGFTSFEVKNIAYRNQFIFVWKNATDVNLQFLHLLWLPYYFIKALIGMDLAFLIGFFNALVLFPKILRYSFQDQKLFVKKDSEVVSFLNKKN